MTSSKSHDYKQKTSTILVWASTQCSLHHAIMHWSSIHVYYQICWGQYKESCVLMDNRCQIEGLESILIKAGSWIYSPSRMFTIVKQTKWRTFHLTSLPNLWFFVAPCHDLQANAYIHSGKWPNTLLNWTETLHSQKSPNKYCQYLHIKHIMANTHLGWNVAEFTKQLWKTLPQ